MFFLQVVTEAKTCKAMVRAENAFVDETDSADWEDAQSRFGTRATLKAMRILASGFMKSNIKSSPAMTMHVQDALEFLNRTETSFSSVINIAAFLHVVSDCVMFFHIKVSLDFLEFHESRKSFMLPERPKEDAGASSTVYTPEDYDEEEAEAAGVLVVNTLDERPNSIMVEDDLKQTECYFHIVKGDALAMEQYIPSGRYSVLCANVVWGICLKAAKWDIESLATTRADVCNYVLLMYL